MSPDNGQRMRCGVPELVQPSYAAREFTAKRSVLVNGSVCALITLQ